MKNKPRILVVDDDNFILKIIEELLLKEGFAVATASNTIGAGYLLKDFEPDLVVLDIMLPGSLSGDAACDTLRRFCPGIKIVFYSGIDEQQLQALGKRHRADAVLAKGGRVSELVKTVRSLLDAKEKNVD